MSPEEQNKLFTEALTLKLHAAILDQRAEAKAAQANKELFSPHKAIAEAFIKFGVDTGLIEEDDLLVTMARPEVHRLVVDNSKTIK